MGRANENVPAAGDGRDANQNHNPAGLQGNYKPSKLDIHFLIGGKTVCAAEYRLSPGTRFIELPLPIARLLSA